MFIKQPHRYVMHVFGKHAYICKPFCMCRLKPVIFPSCGNFTLSCHVAVYFISMSFIACKQKPVQNYT